MIWEGKNELILGSYYNCSWNDELSDTFVIVCVVLKWLFQLLMIVDNKIEHFPVNIENVVNISLIISLNNVAISLFLGQEMNLNVSNNWWFTTD